MIGYGHLGGFGLSASAPAITAVQNHDEGKDATVTCKLRVCQCPAPGLLRKHHEKLLLKIIELRLGAASLFRPRAVGKDAAVAGG